MSGRSGKCLGAPSFATGFAPHRSRCIPSSAEREDETLRRLALGGFTAAVVAGGGDGVGVASQLLHGEDVGPGLEQGGDKGPAQVVRGEGSRSGLLLPAAEDEGTDSPPMRRIGISPFWRIGQTSGPTSSPRACSQRSTRPTPSGVR